MSDDAPIIGPRDLPLIEACSWMRKRLPADARIPGYKLLKARAADGFFETYLDGRNRKIPEGEIPRMLACFGLVETDGLK